MTRPHLKFFVRKYREVLPAGLRYTDIEKMIIFDMLDYHYNHGVSGFLSERSTLEGIFSKVKEITDSRWFMYSNPDQLVIDKIIVSGDPDKDKILMSEIESEKHFLRWVV